MDSNNQGSLDIGKVLGGKKTHVKKQVVKKKRGRPFKVPPKQERYKDLSIKPKDIPEEDFEELARMQREYLWDSRNGWDTYQ